MAAWNLPSELSAWIAALAGMLHARVAGRLEPLLVGALFAQGRRTVASWLRAGELGHDFRRYYYFLGSLGRTARLIAMRLLYLIVRQLGTGPRILLAIDDTPTKRYGPKVEGAGIHHNPTPGPADQKFLYGHVWVVMAWVVRHPCWGTIALPLCAELYVRACEVVGLPRWYRWKFRTKLEQAATLVQWAASYLKHLGITLWVVTDGAYAKRPFLQPAQKAGLVVVSRLRKDAALFDLPQPPKHGQRRGRGRPRKYGKKRISLAKRAGQRGGWQTGPFQLYGELVTKTYKTFLSTYAPAGGLIRVVLVRETHGWVAFFCTDPEASVADILEAVADRASLEQVFHDQKEVHGTGQQQLRHLWANIGAFHLNLWWHTLIELWAWNRTHGQLCDRRDSPWDDPARRPSHADRRNSLRRECIQHEFSTLDVQPSVSRKIRQLFTSLLNLAA
jgi:hypothetical protein